MADAFYQLSTIALFFLTASIIEHQTCLMLLETKAG
jgi:hypothetical protein